MNLYDRPSTTENVLAGTLSFSDGSTIAVGALPPGGHQLPVTFTPRTVSWVRFTINQAQGTQPGLSEIEVLGRPAGVGNVPPHFLRGPVATPSTILASEVATLQVDSADLDGDPVQVEWSADAGFILGSGPSVQLIPPAVAVNTVITITARLLDARGGSATHSTFVTLQPGPNPLTVALVDVVPGVVGGSPATGTVTLNGTATGAGAVVTFTRA